MEGVKTKVYKDVYCDYTKEELLQCGVYAIKNKKTSKMYIGSTCANFHQRWIMHLYPLFKNKHCNCILQRNFNKYGFECFQFIILQSFNKNTINRDELIKTVRRAEQMYINEYNTVSPNGFNIASDVEIGVQHRYESTIPGINKNAFADTIKYLQDLGALDEDVDCLENNVYHILQVASMYLEDNVFENFRNYLFKNMVINNRGILSGGKKINSNYQICDQCASFDPMNHYCQYNDMYIPNVFIPSCSNCYYSYNDKQNYMYNTFKAQDIDDIIEDFLFGKF